MKKPLLIALLAVMAAVSAAKEGVFNLAGQRLAAPRKGLNIVNGRKVLVK